MMVSPIVLLRTIEQRRGFEKPMRRALVNGHAVT
jgi:hypothetical protein